MNRAKYFIPVIMLAGFYACTTAQRTPGATAIPPEVKKIAVLGFSQTPLREESPAVYRCPVCGATFMAGYVPEVASKHMTSELFAALRKAEKYNIVPPGQSKGAYSAILSREVNLKIMEILKETGRSLSCDAVLFGYIFRWRERKGTEYAVESPASVAFDLHLIGAENGSIIWRGGFDKTQQSLTENLIDISTFLKAGGKWLTAQELAEIGLDRLLKEISPVMPDTTQHPK